MTEQGFKRKLTAILSADVVGYSRLMRDDEEATVRDIDANRVLITEIIQQHHGRVVDSPGDNILAEFASVVDAVNGAIKIQDEIKKNNADTPEDRQMAFRIGINLGDVIEEKGRIYGDGVNIAARVEGLAAGGGIAISGIVYDSIKDKLSLGYHYLGEQDVKNIPEPVRIYRLLTNPADAGKMIGEEKSKSKKFRYATFSGLVLIILVVGALLIWDNYIRAKIEPASIDKMAFPLPDKPSIAVLPFDNMSGNPEDEFIADGMSESIITALSKTQKMFVISRNSTFSYKGKTVKIKNVAEDLGVRYVLEGSIQKSNDQLRINAQLIDAINGNHLWAEKYDRNLIDFFALQDDITMKIITALQVELSDGEKANVIARGTVNLGAYLKVVQGLHHFERVNKEGDAMAQKLAREAISLDSGYPAAYYLLSRTHMREPLFGTTKSPKLSLKLAIENAQKAVSLDKSFAEAEAFLGWLYTMNRQYDKGIAAAERALALNFNLSPVYSYLGLTLNYAGRHEEAIKMFKKGIRLSPIPSVNALSLLCMALRDSGRYEEGISTAKTAISLSHGNLLAHTCLASCYALQGRDAEASAESTEILNIDPNFSLENLAKNLPYKNPAGTKLVIDSLIKAGIPEHSPLKLPDKPSIAVLAFDNLSGDPDHEFIADGISENIITALSSIPQMFVIDRNSSFTYKGKPVKIQQVSEDLGVRYVLEGSVLVSGEKIRITAQLIDALTGGHIWSERYDRDLRDFFNLIDEITLATSNVLHVELTEGWQASILTTDNLDAWRYLVNGSGLLWQGGKENVAKARELFEKALELDPGYTGAVTMLGWTYWIESRYGLTDSRQKSFERAIEFAKKSLSMDANHPGPHELLSMLYLYQKQHNKAIEEGRKCIALGPSRANGHLWLGVALYRSGIFEEAVQMLERARRLHPNAPHFYIGHMMNGYYWVGRYEESLAMAEQLIARAQKGKDWGGVWWGNWGAARAHIRLGQEKKARENVVTMLKIRPNYGLYEDRQNTLYKPGIIEREHADMRKAGMPELAPEQ